MLIISRFWGGVENAYILHITFPSTKKEKIKQIKIISNSFLTIESLW